MNENEILNCIVTYAGDITDKLKVIGSRCPFRLNADGNTEQMVECFRGIGAGDTPIETLAKMIEPSILQDCANNGTVIGCRWALATKT